MTSSPFRVRMLRLTALQDGTASRPSTEDDVSGPVDATEWYVVETKLNKERLALKELARKVPVVFLPLRELTDIADGRRKYRETPLFPSHLFVALQRSQSLAELRYVPGVRDDGSSRPVPVPSFFVSQLRRLARVSHTAEAEPDERSQQGEFLSGFETFKSLFRGDTSNNERIAVLFGALRSQEHSGQRSV